MTRMNLRGVGFASVGLLVVVASVIGGGLATPVGKAAQTEQTKWPPLFPRAGATKVLETDRVIVWDQVYTAEEIVHKHIRDILVFAVEDGPIRVSTPSGVPTAGAERVGEVSLEHVGLPRVGGYFRAGIGPHSEALIDPTRPRRYFFVEFKGTEPADCKEWSSAC